MFDDVDDDTNQSRENIANHSRYPNHALLYCIWHLVYRHCVRQSNFSTTDNSSTNRVTQKINTPPRLFKQEREENVVFLQSALGYFGLDLIHAGRLRDGAQIA
jgi:hypothetical protein